MVNKVPYETMRDEWLNARLLPPEGHSKRRKDDGHHFNLAMFDDIYRLGSKVMTPNEAAPAKWWSCPNCAFTFDAVHEDDIPGGGYSCPLCEETRLQQENQGLREAVAKALYTLDCWLPIDTDAQDKVIAAWNILHMALVAVAPEKEK